MRKAGAALQRARMVGMAVVFVAAIWMSACASPSAENSGKASAPVAPTAGRAVPIRSLPLDTTAQAASAEGPPIVWEHEFFGLRWPLPAGWTIASEDTSNFLIEMGQEIQAGDDPAQRAHQKASRDRTTILLLITEHPVGAPVPFNSMIMLTAEDVAWAPGIRDGADYLAHVMRSLQSGPVAFRSLGKPRKVSLSSTSFHRQDMAIESSSAVQSYLAARRGDYVLSILVTADSRASVEELFDSLRRLEIRPED